jgi:hypothetical protein
LRSIVLHWTAHDYASVFEAYHLCIGLRGEEGPLAIACTDLRANMRDVRLEGAPYAAHTRGRNSYAIGLAICAMEDATPSDFGRYPLREDFIDVACATAAELCAFYGIPIDERHVYTHAEAALEDGYFGCGEDERWDIARLTPSLEPLQPEDARRVGEELRRRVRHASNSAAHSR